MNANTQFLIAQNKRQGEVFQSPDEVERRREYLRHHKTQIMVPKCMDGRVNVPVITGIPMGVISPYRSMGARFEIGSPGFAPHVRNFHDHVQAEHEVNENAFGLVMATYHYSKGDPKRGCKGFNYDTDAARAYARGLREEFATVYGSSHTLIHPIKIGIETDEDTLIIHGDTDAALDVSTVLDAPSDAIEKRLRALFPEMKEPVLQTLLLLALGNQKHVRQVRSEQRPIIDLDHRETTIAVGRGFDWLHLVNEALIVGPFNVNWLDEVAVAANIVLHNLEREPELARDGATLLVSAPYRGMGVDAAVARKKAMYMLRESWKKIKAEVPELLKYDFDVLVGTLDRGTMLMRWMDVNQNQLS